MNVSVGTVWERRIRDTSTDHRAADLLLNYDGKDAVWFRYHR